jgi:hypothetical protein
MTPRLRGVYELINQPTSTIDPTTGPIGIF